MNLTNFTNLHPSHYLKIFPWPDDPAYLLLYSTKNAALALVPAETGLQLQQGEVPADSAAELAELGMAVTDLEAERAEVFDLLAEINSEDEGLNVAVILGLACNFGCVYCYEGNLKGNRGMDRATAAQTVTFVQERYLARDKKRLRLDFYGGEPLLYPDRIEEIARPLKEFIAERDGDFRFSLVSNGSLLTREMVLRLKAQGLHAAKVTVDGPPEVHDRLRPFKGGGGSFATIMVNLCSCAGLVKIGFGGNYTRESYQTTVELLDLAAAHGLGPEVLGQVQFHPVLAVTDVFANPEFSGGCLTSDEPWLAEAALFVRDEAISRGFPAPRMIPSPCMVELDDALVINYDGRIFKCVAMIGHPEYAVGDVWQGQGTIAAYRPGHWRENEECRDCVYLPLCFGGCCFMAFQREGDMGRVDCRRGFYDRVLERTVVGDARQRAEE